MDFRNAQFNHDGSITCEILHPNLGWIGFTACEDDVEPQGPEVHHLLKDTALPYDPEPIILDPQPEPVPASITRFQARSQLHISGLLSAADEAVSHAAPLVQIAWADAQVFLRSSPNIAAIAQALDLSPDEVDDLFREAAKITA